MMALKRSCRNSKGIKKVEILVFSKIKIEVGHTASVSIYLGLFFVISGPDLKLNSLQIGSSGENITKYLELHLE